jgi:GTP-binding protein YchF
MELGIIGLPQSGKTTLFNALTRGHAETGTYGASIEPNIGVVKVPDPRLDALVPLFNPKKTTYADVRYVDFPATAMAGFGREGPSGQFIAALARTDAFIQVVRAFHNEAVPHPEGSVDPARDIAALHLELIFADLAFLERQLERMDTAFRSARAGEREGLQRQVDLYTRLKAALEREEPLRDQAISDDERKMLSGFPLLTLKPVLVLLNVDEGDAGRTEELAEAVRATQGGEHVAVLAIAGKLEEDLAQMSPEEGEEFRRELGLQASGLDAVVRQSYALLGLISFLTVGPDECRAWTLRRGATAPEAAGTIHSDLQRGFIRAEVIQWSDLLECGTYAEARKRGLLRSEGKGYVVQDGDVLNILFNV